MLNQKEHYEKLINEIIQKQEQIGNIKSKMSYFLKGLMVVFIILVLLSGVFIISLYLLTL